MIVFDLRCVHGDVFEAWFASSAAYEDQCARNLLACPICGTSDVSKAVMAPRVGAKSNRGSGPAAQSAPAEAKAMLQALAKAQTEALRHSRWVGTGFAEEARAMHLGERPHETIHGRASPDEARSLIEDGVEVTPLILPVVPPEVAN